MPLQRGEAAETARREAQIFYLDDFANRSCIMNLGGVDNLRTKRGCFESFVSGYLV
jgi:hypothetical protein